MDSCSPIRSSWWTTPPGGLLAPPVRVIFSMIVILLHLCHLTGLLLFRTIVVLVLQVVLLPPPWSCHCSASRLSYHSCSHLPISCLHKCVSQQDSSSYSLAVQYRHARSSASLDSGRYVDGMCVEGSLQKHSSSGQSGNQQGGAGYS